MNSSPRHQVEILPENVSLEARDGQSLLELLIGAGILLRSDCGGVGACGKCRVLLSEIETSAERPTCACQHLIRSTLRVTVPSRSRFIVEPAEKEIDPQLLAARLTVSQTGHGRQSGFGVAVDLGTTTIGVYLCDLSTRTVLRSAAVRNPQNIMGLDVISRIEAVNSGRTTPALMQQMAVKAVEAACLELLGSLSISSRLLHSLVVVGNPAMVHLFFGENPASIGVAPFKPVFSQTRMQCSGNLGFVFNKELKVSSLPLLSGFLGSDILAAALAVDMLNQPAGTLLVDIGTNGELMLRTQDGLMATSCATGPAFEGGAIGCGMPAISGAVDAIRLSSKAESVQVRCVGSTGSSCQPEGICGSGLISAIAEFLDKKVILPNGVFNPACRSPRLNRAQKPLRFVIAEKDNRGQGSELFISQFDIRGVQLAKAALSAGIRMLCQEAGGIRPDLVIVAGAFGNALDIGDCRSIGLFGFLDTETRIESAGNIAGIGAVLALLDKTAAEDVARLIQLTTVKNLADWPQFQDCFVSSIPFEPS